MTKNLRETIYKEEKFILACGFSIQSMVTWLCCFWTCGEAEHHGGNVWPRRAAQKGGGGFEGKIHPLKACPF
jgi:hypothetical protein